MMVGAYVATSAAFFGDLDAGTPGRRQRAPLCSGRNRHAPARPAARLCKRAAHDAEADDADGALVVFCHRHSENSFEPGENRGGDFRRSRALLSRANRASRLGAFLSPRDRLSSRQPKTARESSRMQGWCCRPRQDGCRHRSAADRGRPSGHGLESLGRQGEAARRGGRQGRRDARGACARERSRHHHSDRRGGNRGRLQRRPTACCRATPRASCSSR